MLIRSITIASALALALGLAATSNAAEPQTGTSGAKTKTPAKQVTGTPKGKTGPYTCPTWRCGFNGIRLTGVALGEASGLGSAAVESVVLPGGGTAGRK